MRTILADAVRAYPSIERWPAPSLQRLDAEGGLHRDRRAPYLKVDEVTSGEVIRVEVDGNEEFICPINVPSWDSEESAPYENPH